jgi:hypothetical protein
VPSPVAHVGLALCGALALLPRPWRLHDLGLVAFLGVLPDFDLIPDLLGGDGIRYHHGPTHSLAFALAGATLLWWRLPPRHAIAGALALLIHAPLDYTTGEPGAPSKYGVAWAWPVSDARFISADPFFGAYHIDREGGLLHMFVGEALPHYAREAAVVAVAAVLALGVRRALPPERA